MKSGINADRIDEIVRVRRYALLSALLWTVLICGIFISYFLDNRHAITEIGHSMALASFEKDLLFRRWAAMHGGVYVPETAVTPPNPYLSNIQERDIATPSGRRLTLVNPAYMSRQVFELAAKQPDIPHGHITSLNPIRPENKPDKWEIQALNQLKGGSLEVSERMQINGKPHLRFMRPLKTDKPCLRCHAAQGYREGDDRGGISVTLSLVQITETMNRQMFNVALTYVIFWLIGLGFILLVNWKVANILMLLRDERNSLRDSKNQLKDVIDFLPDATLAIDTEKRVIIWNRAIEEMTGIPAGEMIGKGDYAYTVPFYGEARPQLMDLVLEDHDEITARYPNIVRNGQTLLAEVFCNALDNNKGAWVFAKASPLHDRQGNIIGVIESIRDITGRKKAEQERTLLEQQFQQSQKLESLGVLAGGIAHDFNNILTIILGYCYMARGYIKSEQEYKDSFSQVESAANRAADLCRQMLTYAGKSPSAQTGVNLLFLTEEVVKMLQSAIKKNVSIELDLDSSVPEVMGDAGQIQQVVMNLIINAAEAIGDSNGAVRVSLKNIAIEPGCTGTDAFGTPVEAGGYVSIDVSDTGCGMSEDTQKRIFEPFFTTKFLGRGLGMSAIRGIVKSHNATLSLTSAPGLGTTFMVNFPVTEHFDRHLPITPTPVESGNGTILIVDDEQTQLIIGKTIFKGMGFSVITAINGLEALEIYRARSGEIDVIMLDLVMPVMGGIEAYRELRMIDPAVPILICSGYSGEPVLETICHDDRAGFIYKPYKPEELLSAVMKLKKQYKP